MCFNIGVLNFDEKSVNFDKNFGRKFLEGNFAEKFGKKGNFGLWRAAEQLGNLLSLCREIAGARDILQKFENLKKQHE